MKTKLEGSASEIIQLTSELIFAQIPDEVGLNLE
jgi:hypothetical protein